VARKRKKATQICPGCRGTLKGGWVSCPHCGRTIPVLDRTGKASIAALTKSAASRCSRCGNAPKAGTPFCTRCGGQLLQVVKTASPDEIRRQHWLQKARNENNPDWQEAYWRLAHPEQFPGGAA
jgi:predicted amidophosphoribosyltransferase